MKLLSLPGFIVGWMIVFVAGSVRAKDATPRPQQQYLSPEVVQRMSFEEMKAEAKKRVQEIRETVDRVLQVYAEAEKTNDVAGARCLGEVLTLMKGLRRLGDQNLVSLSEAIANQDREQAEHEFVKVVIASNKMPKLYAKAQGCGGPGLQTIFEGKPVVEKYTEKYIPVEDTRVGPELQWVPVVEPPPAASPFY